MRDSGGKPEELIRWTRDKLLQFPWNSYESFESLILNPALRERFATFSQLFRQGENSYQKLELPWRYGFFFFGPSGSGKTAAGRGLSHQLGWPHFAIPSHEILDAHFLERALCEAVSRSRVVVEIEDVDLILTRMEPEVFFNLLDHAIERSVGHIWIATSRHAENAPKTQLVRPGRFDESVRFELPSLEMRRALFRSLFHLQEDDPWLIEWGDLSDGLTYSHFSEMRQVVAKMKLEEKDPAGLQQDIQTYIEDQRLSGDRLGGLSDETSRLEERVQQVDPRMLTAALNFTDILKTLMEKVIGDAMEKSSLTPEDDK